jgi:hypothetical protein
VTGGRDRQVTGPLDRVAVSDGQRCTTVYVVAAEVSPAGDQQ